MKKKICLYIVCIILISIILLSILMSLNNIAFRPLILEYIIISLLSILNIFLLVFLIHKKSITLLILFGIVSIITLNNIKLVNTFDSVVIVNNVKLIKVRNKKNNSYKYYKYINFAFMSKEMLMEESYTDEYVYKSSNENEPYVNYYNDVLKEYSNSKLEIYYKKSYMLKNISDNRIIEVITNDNKLKKFNEEMYDISEIGTIDFSKYNILAISYNSKEIVPCYLGMLNNNINLVIKNKKEVNFSNLLVLKIEKREFNDIKISDFDTYENLI